MGTNEQGAAEPQPNNYPRRRGEKEEKEEKEEVVTGFLSGFGLCQ